MPGGRPAAAAARAGRWPGAVVRAASRGCEPEFAEVPFGHPLWVLYSSGTTGLPKAIVHGHGGIVLEHLKALGLHQDLGPGDVFFWYTTTGWMMWNYLAGGLLAGATVVLYDGSATYPGTDALWRLAAETGVTYFGTGAPYLLACAKAGLRPGPRLDLSALRGIGSTGSPLPPEGFHWVYRGSGAGQDLHARLVLRRHRPVHRVRRARTRCCRCGPGSSPGRCLGAKVGGVRPRGPAADRRGRRAGAHAPMPSMPVGFWNDPGGVRYRASYFAEYPGVWRHGDWITMLPDGGCVIYGRSDATLNRGGVRMGTSEFYRVVERLPEITDSLVVDTGQLGQDGRLILYVVLAEGREPGRRADRPDQVPAARRAVAAARARRDQPGTRHPADAVREETRGTGAQDPARHPDSRGGRSGRAGQPRGAQLLRRLCWRRGTR